MNETNAGTGGRKRRAASLVAGALAMMVAFAAPAAAATSVVPVAVQPRQVFTDTKIQVHAGDAVSITASGRIHFGPGRITAIGPAGIPWGVACATIAKGQARGKAWPAPGINCWSLIAKVGAGAPFEIGVSKTFRAAADGELFIGVNDNAVIDNSGTWLANVSVPGAGSGSGPPGVSGGKSSNTGTFVLLALVLVAAALVLIVFLRRRAVQRRRLARVMADVAPGLLPPLILEPTALPTPREPDPLPAILVAEPEPVVEEPEPLPIGTVTAPPETNSIDVNIFEVEFSNGLTLRVGYNHFPEGTQLQWRVTQNRALAASGYFVTKGGGSTRNFETVPLGVKLEGRAARPEGADVQFDWAINGVPFRYSVRRDPNC